MAEVSLATIITALTKTEIYGRLIDVAEAVGLNTESWQKGDPERALFLGVATMDEERELDFVGFAKAGFLDLASGYWLTLLARYAYAVERRGATYATCTVRYTNSGAAVAEIVDPEDSTVRNSSSGATFRNSTVGVISPGSYLDVTVEADVAGSGSNSLVGEIDELVTSIPNVTVTNTTAASATDEETDEELRARCRAKLQSLSSAGPAGAYHYFATTPEYNGGASITRTRTIADSNTGDVTTYYAGPSGAVSVGDVALANAAIEAYAVPLCISFTGLSATNVVQAVTYQLYVYDGISKTSAEIQADVAAELLAAFRSRSIAGTDAAVSGTVYQNWIEAVILRAVDPYGYRVTVTLPAGNVSLTAGQVLTLGTVTGTVTLVEE